MKKTHDCTLGYYGHVPFGITPGWDGELFTETAAQGTVNNIEIERIAHPDRPIETPFGMCRSVRAYLDSGRIVWELEEIA